MGMTSLQRLKIWSAYKNEYKILLRLGLPVLITEIGKIVVSFADTMMVGAYGTKELAAAAFVNSFFVVAIVMLIGFAAGATPLFGALYSQKKNLEMGQTIRVSLQLNAIAGVVFTIVMGVLYFFLDRMGQPEELLSLIRSYYLIVLASLIPMAVFNCFQQLANGVNDTAMPMWVMLGMNVLNIVGNYVLIFGCLGFPELGLVGAGVSTLFARLVGAVVITIIVLRSRRYSIYHQGLMSKVPLSNERKHALKIAIPVMLQNGIECVLWSFGAVVCGWFGTLQLAGYQVVITISQLGFMTYLSFGVAVSIRVANYMGINDLVAIRRISSAGLHINLLLATIACAIFIVGSEYLLGLFTQDADVISVGLALIPPLVLYQYGDAVQITYANALRGTSHVAPLLWISIICYLCVGVPLQLLLATTFGLKSIGVYYSFSGALFLAAVLLIWAFRRTLKRHRQSQLFG